MNGAVLGAVLGFFAATVQTACFLLSGEVVYLALAAAFLAAAVYGVIAARSAR